LPTDAETLPAPSARSMPRAIKNPLQREMDAGRIDPDLDLTRDIFEREYNTSYWQGGGSPHPGSMAPDSLIGVEHTGDAALFCRYLTYRVDLNLFDALFNAVILGYRMEDLAHGYDGQSTAAKVADGRSRLVAALTLASAAMEDWFDLVDGDVTSRLAYGLGPVVTSRMPRSIVERANVLARATGNSICRKYSRGASALRTPCPDVGGRINAIGINATKAATIPIAPRTPTPTTH
jgi:hypothetical protein